MAGYMDRLGNKLDKQRGVSLSGLIAVLAVLGVLALVALKVFPAVLEYRAVKSAIASAKSTGGTVREIQSSFDKNAEINDITAIKGSDLVIANDSGTTEIGFAYEKRIPLFSNVTLLIDFAGTTDPKGVAPEKPAADTQ